MSDHFDDLETQSADERHARQIGQVQAQVARAKARAPYFADSLAGIDPEEIRDVGDLAKLPLVRKSDLMDVQMQSAPFGGMTATGISGLARVYMSPGPILDPEGRAAGHDWWRFGRAAWAAGIRSGDIVANCFSYHLTPAGRMFEEAAHACGAAVLPAGIGNTEAVVNAMYLYRTSAFCGTPDIPRRCSTRRRNWVWTCPV